MSSTGEKLVMVVMTLSYFFLSISRSHKRKAASHLPDELAWMDGGMVRVRLFSFTRDRTFWSDMISHVVKGHGT